jgi:hypothetical protein
MQLELIDFAELSTLTRVFRTTTFSRSFIVRLSNYSNCICIQTIIQPQFYVLKTDFLSMVRVREQTMKWKTSTVGSTAVVGVVIKIFGHSLVNFQFIKYFISIFKMFLKLLIIIQFKFSGHLQVVEEITLRDFNSARNGLQIRRPQPARQRNQDARIAAETHNLNVGRITLIEFLEIASNFFEPADLPTEVTT